MKKINFGQTISILANVGVIAGIIFLALELRQLDEQIASQSRFNYYSARVENLRSLAENPYLAAILAKKASGETLTLEENFRLGARARSTLADWEYQFGEYAEGRLSLGDLAVPLKRQLYSDSLIPVRDIYMEIKQASDVESTFIEFMEEHIVDP